MLPGLALSNQRSIRTKLSTSFTGSGLSATAFTAVNSVVLRPIPNARVSTAAVNPGLLASVRPAYRRSLNRVSIGERPRRSRSLSLSWVTSPMAMRAARFASWDSSPPDVLFDQHVEITLDLAIEFSVESPVVKSSASFRSENVKPRKHTSAFRSRLEQPADHAGDSFPVVSLLH